MAGGFLFFGVFIEIVIWGSAFQDQGRSGNPFRLLFFLLL
jgi:hypothetical protein